MMHPQLKIRNRRTESSPTYDDLLILPEYSEVSSRNDVSLEQPSLDGTGTIDIPVISAPMDTITGMEMATTLSDYGAIGAIHRFHGQGVDFYREMSVGRQYIVSVGVNEDVVSFIESLPNHKFAILIDVAHGHTRQVRETIEKIKSHDSSIHVIAGNVCTYTGAKDLVNWGADSVRCGIGPGAMCTTRIQTGVGLPQAAAVLACKEGILDSNNPNARLIADGGIKHTGDVAKAIGLGADFVMIGSMLAGTAQTPGEVVERDGLLYKMYRGSASRDAKLAAGMTVNYVEGESTLVPYKGDVRLVLDSIADGLRSACSYVGALTLDEFRETCSFMRISPTAIAESYAHGVQKR